MKKVNQDPFSNGSEHRAFEAYCCDKCVKSSEPRDDFRYTNADKNMMPKCSIQRDIVLRMFSNEPIKQKTIDKINIENQIFRKIFSIICEKCFAYSIFLRNFAVEL